MLRGQADKKKQKREEPKLLPFRFTSNAKLVTQAFALDRAAGERCGVED